jgi:hypothetical protein
MGTIADRLTELQATKMAIKTAIEEKGQSLSGVPFTEYASKIREISGGGDSPNPVPLTVTENGVYENEQGFSPVTVDIKNKIPTDTTATAGDIREGKTAYVNGEKVTGSLIVDVIQSGLQGVEIEITSDITNVYALRQTLFNGIQSAHSAVAVLTKAKNNEVINNQVIALFAFIGILSNGYGVRIRDGKYTSVDTTISYDAWVTIGDVYTVYDLGEAYGN